MRCPALPLLLALGLMTPVATAQKAPFTVAPDLFDVDRPGDLGLQMAPGTQIFTIHAPTAGSDTFHNGVVLIAFQGVLHAQWQVSQRDEDTLDTWIAHSRSEDGGRTWTPPVALSPSATKPGEMRSNGGWWTDGRRLVAFTNVWPTGFQSGDGGYAEYRISEDGRNWSPPPPRHGQGWQTCRRHHRAGPPCPAGRPHRHRLSSAAGHDRGPILYGRPAGRDRLGQGTVRKSAV